MAQWTDATRDVLPQRLGHSLLFTAQPKQMTEFYTQVLGLGLSDTIHHDLVTFRNAGPLDPPHFGFISSIHRGCHHASSAVPSIDATRSAADRMRSKGHEALGSGPFTPSHRRIEDDAAWVPRTFDPAEPGSIDMWLGPTARPITQPQLRSADPAQARGR